MTPPAAVDVTIDAGSDERPDVVWLSNGSVRLGFVPALGGRLMSSSVRGVETLWRNSRLLDEDLHPVDGHRPHPHHGELRDWANYGGDKTWPAPQGWSGPDEWAGPPDPVLDSGAYEWEIVERADGAVTLVMTSDADPRTGLTLTRSFTLEPGSLAYDVLLEARNTGDRTVTWALWNVAQRRAGAPEDDGVIVGMASTDHVGVPLAVGTGAPVFESLDRGRVRVPHQRVVGKVGFANTQGWLAHVGAGTTSTVLFEVDRDGTYPDEGSEVEVWMEHPLDEPLSHLGDLKPFADIVEIEVLGPLRRLEPGEISRLTMRCAVVGEAHPDITLVERGGHRSSVGFTSYTAGESVLHASGARNGGRA